MISIETVNARTAEMHRAAELSRLAREAAPRRAFSLGFLRGSRG
jgi:hypothetical protein